MKLSVTAPAPAGCALIRDVRCWHGGTPNCACFTSLRSGVYAVRLCGDLTRPVWCQPLLVQCLAKFEAYRLQRSTHPGTSHRRALRATSDRCHTTLGAGAHFSNEHSAHSTVSLMLFLCLSATVCGP